jgi:hypothetical protein
MARVLHLLKRDSHPHAGPVIAESLREPGAHVTVVLLDDGSPPPLPAGVPLRRLGRDLDHDALLDLIFEHDHVITW